jgi:hypothetical protein
LWGLLVVFFGESAALFGVVVLLGLLHRDFVFSMESLILAQDERWRRA